MFINSFLSLSILALLVAILPSCDNQEVPQVLKTEVQTVKFIRISDTGQTKTKDFSVTIDAVKTLNLGIDSDGVLEKLTVKEGQVISRGDLIAQLDQKGLPTTLRNAEAYFEQLDKQYRDVIDFNEETDSSKTDEYAPLELEWRQAKSDLEKAQQQLDKISLYAPYDGVVIRVMATPLQTVSAGQVLVEVMSDDLMSAKFDSADEFSAFFAKDQKRFIDLKQASIVIASQQNHVIDIPLSQVQPSMDNFSSMQSSGQNSGFTFKPPEDFIVFPQTKAILHLSYIDTTEPLRVTLPLDAVSSDGTQAFVWVIDTETTTITKRVVSLQPSIEKSLTITKGLSMGEVIVGSHASYLAEGMQVREEK